METNNAKALHFYQIVHYTTFLTFPLMKKLIKILEIKENNLIFLRISSYFLSVY